MKKTLSILLAVIIALLPLSQGVFAFAKYDMEAPQNPVLKKSKNEYTFYVKYDGCSRDFGYEDNTQIQYRNPDGKFKAFDGESFAPKIGVKYDLRIRFAEATYDEDFNLVKKGKSRWTYFYYDLTKKVPKIKSFEPTKSGFYLHINTVYYSSKIRVYRYNKSTKEYKAVKTVKSYGTEPDVFIKTSKSHKYCVKAISTVNGKNYYSKKSASFTASNIKKTKVKIKSLKSNKIAKFTLKWEKCKAKGCTGYQISYNTEGPYTGFTTSVKGVKKTSRTVSKNCIEGLTYWVKIRPAFKKKYGTVYGKWSKYQKVSLKSGIPSDIDTKKLINKQTLAPVKPSNKRLNKIVNKIIKKNIKSDMTNYEKLFAVYKYVSNEKFSNYGITGSNDYTWDEEGRALELLDNKKGDCTKYNSLFCILARRIGFQDVRYTGGLVHSGSGGYVNHYWSMFKMNGHFYLFDPRLDMYQIKDYGRSKDSDRYFCIPFRPDNDVLKSYRYGYYSVMYDFYD